MRRGASMRLSAAAAAACCWLAAAHGQTVSLGGSLGDKALLVIDGVPRTVKSGDTVGGVKLVAVTPDGAVVDVGGRRATIRLGGAQVDLGGAANAGSGTQIVL